MKTLTPIVIQEYDRQEPAEVETATFGLGCFWGPDAAFGAIDGVIRTQVGYAGGTKPGPSYDVIGDHTEVIQVEYDPEAASFATLLNQAFDHHNPYHQPKKRQYHNIIFTTSESQEHQLEEYLTANGFDRRAIETRVESFTQFYLAEDYHQKFTLRGKRWITDVFDELGYNSADIRESPAAAKLNAHAAGHDVSAPFLSEPYNPSSNSRQ